MLKIMSMVLMLSMMAGCASLQTPQSTQAVAEQGAIQFLVIKELNKEKTSNPAKAQALAQNAREAIKQINAVLDGDAGLTFQALHDQVTKIIAAQNYDPATLVAVSTLRQMVDTSLQDVQNNATLVPGILTPQEVAGIKTVLGKISEAIMLAGF